MLDYLRSLLHCLKQHHASWKLGKAIDAGTAPRGRTDLSEDQ